MYATSLIAHKYLLKLQATQTLEQLRGQTTSITTLLSCWYQQHHMFFFNFLSKAWGGRTSDVHLTRESSFYDIIEPRDEVMADRGFTIAEDLLIRRSRLHIPPGKRGQEQFTKDEVAKTKEIANLRIFVEQAIRRLKTFRLIKHELPISLLGSILCTYLCSLM